MFHGQSGFKIIIKYNKTGDGFQVDSICSNGYILSFYFLGSAATKTKFGERFVSTSFSNYVHSWSIKITIPFSANVHLIHARLLCKEGNPNKNNLDLTVSQENTKD